MACGEFLNLCLKRSGSLPLSIRYMCEVPQHWQSIRSLNEHSSRWEVVHFTLPGSSFHSFNPVRGRTPLLRKATLVALGPHRHGHSEEKIVGLSASLRLADINLKGPIFVNAYFHWNALTKCRLVHAYDHYCLEILRKAHYLLDLTLVDMRGHPLHPITPFQLTSSIQSLTLSTSGVSPFLGGLTLPSLRVLSFSCPWPLKMYVTHFTRAPVHLEELSLLEVTFSPADLRQWFPVIPSLSKLAIGGFTLGRNSVGDDVLNTLVFPQERGGGTTSIPLLPQLRSLHLRGSLEFSDAKLLELISSRNSRVGGTLHSVRLDHVGQPSEERIRKLAALSREGLEVLISGNSVGKED